MCNTVYIEKLNFHVKLIFYNSLIIIKYGFVAHNLFKLRFELPLLHISYIANFIIFFNIFAIWLIYCGQIAMASRAEIGKKVRIARKSLGYTQQKLSELTRINKTTISEIENGRFTGSFDIFERVLDAVDLQFDVSSKQHLLPHWDEIENLFAEEDE